MKHTELGEIFKINIDNKIIYLKVEQDTSEYLCENCYFQSNGSCIEEIIPCNKLNRKDNVNVVFKQINVIEKIYVIIGTDNTSNDKIKWTVCAYSTKEDAEKKIEKLTKLYSQNTYHIEEIDYKPYGIIDDIKEIIL